MAGNSPCSRPRDTRSALAASIAAGFAVGVLLIPETPSQARDFTSTHKCGRLLAQTGVRRNVVPRPAVLPVTSCEDDGSEGTLRSVVVGAVSGDTVDLSALTCSTITLIRGQILFDADDLVLHGPAAGITIDGANASSIFARYGSGTLALDHISLVNGYYAGSGQATERQFVT